MLEQNRLCGPYADFDPVGSEHLPSLDYVSSGSTPLIPASPEIQPKFVKGSKRYGRRSTPEFLETTSGVPDVNPADGSLEDNDDSAVPRKREVPDKLRCLSYLLLSLNAPLLSSHSPGVIPG